MNIYVDDKKKYKDGWTAMIVASMDGHLDVVNRLLDFKQIDVNLQNKNVSRMLISSYCMSMSLPYFFWMRFF